MFGAKERILQFIELQDISVRKFCEKTSLSHSIFTQKGGIGSDKLSRIFDIYPQLNMDWVITGRGEMKYEKPFWDSLKGSPEDIEKFHQSLRDYPNIDGLNFLAKNNPEVLNSKAFSKAFNNLTAEELAEYIRKIVQDELKKEKKT